MRIVDSLDRAKWSAFVQEHTSGSVFHTPEMFDVFASTPRHTPLVLAALDSIGDLLALLVSVQVRTLPWIFGRVSSRALLYAEPICRDSDQGKSALKAIMEEHDRRMRRRVLFTEVRPLSGSGREEEALAAQGYEHEPYLNYLSDVRPSPEKMIERMCRHGRRELRKGQREGLRAEDATTRENVDVLYSLFQETFAKARVPLAGKELFVNAFRILAHRNMMKMFLVQHEGKPVAGSIVLCHRDTVFFWYAGMRRVKDLHPMEVLVFAMLEWSHSQNYKTFDYGGAGRPDKAYGVREFKAKFGGELVEFGRHRKVYSPWKFAIAERTYEVSRGFWSGHRFSMTREKDA